MQSPRRPAQPATEPVLASPSATKHSDTVSSRAHASSWWRDGISGTIASVVTLGSLLTLGLLGYAPLGLAAAETGIPAAFVTAIVGGLVLALLGRSAMPAGGPSSATALIIAGLVAQCVADPSVRLDRPADVAAIVCVVSVCGVLMGGLQLLFGLTRFGNLAKFVPQPVLAGFMNGVAILIIVAQVPLLLGLPPSAPDARVWSLALAQPAALAIGALAAATVWLVAWRFPRAPAALLGLLVGAGAYAVVHLLAPSVGLGPLTGEVPHRVPWPDALSLLSGPGGELVQRHVALVAITSLLLAVIGSLESILGALSVDQQRHTHHDPNRELLAYGAANIATGLFGGLPLTYMRSRAAALLQTGGTTRVAAVSAALASAVLFVAGGPLIALLPLTVLGGIMVTVALGLVDRWSRQLLVQIIAGDRTRELVTSLAIVIVVCGMTLWLGLVGGVAVGVVLAMIVFIHSMNRSLVRSRVEGSARPSRRIYGPVQESFLADARHQAIILEIEGALFFGTADRVASQLQNLDERYGFVILDLHRVSNLDASGAVMLAQQSERLAASGVKLALAGVSADNRLGRALRAFGTFREQPREDWFPDADYAMEDAERRLLIEADLPPDALSVPVEACSLMAGLAADERAQVGVQLKMRRMAAGEILFAEGERADCLYLVTEGSISIVSRADPSHAMPQRYVSFSPGMMLGETAMLDGAGRTASAIADTTAVVYALSQTALASLSNEHPALGARLYRNIAIHLSQRLRNTASAWRASTS